MRISVNELIDAIRELPEPKDYEYRHLTIDLEDKPLLEVNGNGAKVERNRKLFFEKDELNDCWTIDVS